MSSQGVGNAAQGSTARGSDGNDIPSVHTTEPVPSSVAAKVQQQQVSVPSPRQIPKASVSAIMAAKKTKVKYTNITAQAEQVLVNVETDSRWAWAKHDAIIEPLKMAKRHVSAVVLKNSFLRDFLAADDIADVKKAMSVLDFAAGVGKVGEHLDKPLDSLRIEATMLLSQHRARLAVK